MIGTTQLDTFELETESLSGIRVLIVDDQEALRSIMEAILQKWVRKVVCVDNGAAALREIDKGEIDLVLTDYQMPGIDGLELVRRIRKIQHERNRRLPVVMASSYPEKSLETQFFIYGGDLYVQKPFSAYELLSAVSGALQASAKKSSISSFG